MPKKITFLLSMFFCGGIIFAAQTPLTQQELNTYHLFLTINKENSHMPNILKTNNISAQDLYNILIKRKNALLLKGLSLSMTKSKIDTFLGLVEPSSHGYALSNVDLFKFFVIFSPLILGIPILTTGLAIQQFMAPSHTKTVISSGLIGAGGIISSPTILLGLTIAAGKLEKFLKNIIYYPKIKELNELEKIENSIQALEWHYPDLITQQPTSL